MTQQRIQELEAIAAEKRRRIQELEAKIARRQDPVLAALLALGVALCLALVGLYTPW